MSQCLIIPTNALALACKTEISVLINDSENVFFCENVLNKVARDMVNLCINNNLEWVPSTNKVAYSATWAIVSLARSFATHHGAASGIERYRQLEVFCGVYEQNPHCLEIVSKMYENIHEIVWHFAPKPCWLEITTLSRANDMVLSFGNDHRIEVYMRMQQQLNEGMRPIDVICGEFGIVNDRIEVDNVLGKEVLFAPTEDERSMVVSTAFSLGDLELVDTIDKIFPISKLAPERSINRRHVVKPTSLTTGVSNAINYVKGHKKPEEQPPVRSKRSADSSR